MIRPTIVDALCPDHLKLALDIRVIEPRKVKVVWALFPRQQVLDPVFVPNVALAPDVADWLHVGVDRSEEKAKV